MASVEYRAPVRTLVGRGRFEDVGRFASAKLATSDGGLVPNTFTSCDRDTHGHITKGGSAQLRTMRFEAVLELRG